MKKISLLLILSFYLNLEPVFGQTLYGDRAPQLNCVYPTEAFMEEGGQLIDITRPPFNAIGDGKTDNTEAFVRLYDYLYYNINSYWDWANYKTRKGFKGAFPANQDASYVVYIPDGEYLVSNTIIYSFPLELWNGYSEQLVWIRFFGQSRENTIIRLKDNAPGYGIDQQKPVVSFGKHDFNNLVSMNSIRNLTIDTGRGNPGAVGLDFCGANNTGIHNVAIKSGDGKGKIGLHIRISPSMGYHYDIVVDGFDYGIAMDPYHVTHNTFEYVTLRNQRKAGILVNNSTSSLRRISSENQVPALKITGAGAHVIVLESHFEATGEVNEAIQLDSGHLFARNLEAPGYQYAITGQGIKQVKGAVEEFISDQPIRGLGKKSMPMEILESPVADWENDTAQWAVVENYGATGSGLIDDAEGIQAAMNSGRPVVFFPNRKYLIGKTIEVPATVKQVIGLYSVIDAMPGTRETRFGISENHKDPVFFSDLEIRGPGFCFDHATPRSVVFNHVFTTSYFYDKTTPEKATIFVNNCNGFGKPVSVLENVDAWCRFINTEYKQGSNFITGKNARMWVLGYKVEGPACNFETRDGGQLEVLGGIANQFGSPWPTTEPIIRNQNGIISFVGATNGPENGSRAFDIVIEEIDDGKVNKVMWEKFPERVGRKRQLIIPIYSADLTN